MSPPGPPPPGGCTVGGIPSEQPNAPDVAGRRRTSPLTSWSLSGSHKNAVEGRTTDAVVAVDPTRRVLYSRTAAAAWLVRCPRVATMRTGEHPTPYGPGFKPSMTRNTVSTAALAVSCRIGGQMVRAAQFIVVGWFAKSCGCRHPSRRRISAREMTDTFAMARIGQA